MKLRIGQWGTGVVGAAAVRKLAEHPQFEIVGCFAHGESKLGVDVGLLAGIDPLGVLATNKIDEFIAARPDCVLYMPLVWNVDDMARLLEAGINVISTANFITGLSFGPEAVEKLNDAARRGGVSLYGTGINPGQANILGLAASAACSRIYKITVREAVDATLYASKDTWVSLGFGGPADAPGLKEKVKDRALVFIDTVEMMAHALKVQIDDIGFDAEFATADEDLHLGYMDIAKGTVCALRMTYSGLVKGERVVELQLIWRLGYAMTPEWPVEGYVVEIDGEPSLRLTMNAKGDPSHGGMSTAMNAVHAIEAVCAARPGIVTAAELPLITAAHCVVPRPAA
jgi:hypothetical protein